MFHSFFRSGDNVVPEPTSEAEARYGRAEEGRGDGEGDVAEEFLGECQRLGHPEEEGQP